MTDDASPLAKRIVQSMARIGAGNGISKKHIELLREENGRFTLNGLLSARMIPARKTHDEAGRPAKAHMFNTVEEMEAEITRACGELAKDKAVQAALKTKLIDAPGHGFGAADIQLPVPSISYDFAVLRPCPTCQGKGRGGCPVCKGRARIVCPQCRGQREEWCGQCRGTGHQNGDTAAAPCTWCHGIGRTRCLRCTGSGEIACSSCNGSGNTHCQTCRGAGEMAQVTHLSFAWHCAFHADTRNIPVAVSHLMGKASLLKLAQAGHIDAKPAPAPTDTPPVTDPDAEAVPATPGVIYWAMSAIVPWCEATIKLGQTSFIATAAGSKGRINMCPYFLDKRAPKAARLNNEALSLLLRMGAKRADRELAVLYPIGLSERVRRQVLVTARNTIRSKLRVQIALAWMGSVIAAPLIAWFLNGIAGAALGTLAGIGVYQGILIYGQMRFAKNAGVAYKPRPKFGWEGLAIFIAAAGAVAARLILTTP